MGYPQKLLPKKNFAIIDDKISYLNKLYLIRHTPKKSKEIGRTHELPQYSLNLLGIFKTKHSKIKLKNPNSPYSDYWLSGDKNLRPKWNEIKRDSKRGEIYFKFSEVNNFPFPIESGKQFSKYNLALKHKPTKCNFWHFEIKWYDDNDNEVVIDTSGKKPKIRGVPKLVSSLMRNLYKELGIYEKPKKIPQLPVKYYK